MIKPWQDGKLAWNGRASDEDGRTYNLIDRQAVRAAQVGSSGRVMVDDAHSRIHEGVMYTASARVDSVSDNASMNVVLTTPDSSDWVHVVAEPAIGGSAEFEFYEGTVFTGGTAIPAHNHQRNSENTFAGALALNPTISNTGTPLLLGYFVPGGTGPMATGAAGAGFDGEWVLKPATNYLFRLINRSGQARRASIVCMFYQAAIA